MKPPAAFAEIGAPLSYYRVSVRTILRVVEADILFQVDQDQATHRMFERNGVVVISPSYLRYFGFYAAKKRLPPGIRGLAAVRLRGDGRLIVQVEAEGRRL